MMQSLRTWILANKIAAFVVFMHLLLIIGFQSGMDRTKSASNMGDTVVANLLDANPQKEKSTVSRPTPVKPVEKKKVEATPTPITTTTGSFTPPNQESSLPASSLGGSSTGDPKTISISQAQCSVPEPFYPNLSRRMGEEGKTMVRLFINESGAVEKVALAQSSGIHRLDQAALDAGMRVRCKPFIEFGKVIKVTAIQPYIFRLE
ncbi:energy transducer TonB [Polynucleobacter sp. AM-26B4]|uniref:energy transducer TonB n=1 Tax=Polynucleobacter sp. AM-26B4 TaxID=2689103 RepID=UPI001C0D5B13|nr:energy transducer TonB [Polynucleobacter sp. AM-26B4]MBU3584825.1 TonB family protein [Polynucleobacter sp. AM-26B4]